MIKLSKDSECVRIFKVINNQPTKTGGISRVPGRIVFKDNYVWIYFSGENYIKVKAETDGPYSSFSVSSELFIAAVLAHFSSSDKELEIKPGQKKIAIDDIEFEIGSDTETDSFVISPELTFNEAQWLNIEKYFDNTLENYISPEMIDTIAFFICEGDIHLLSPSYYGLTIKNVSASIDTTALSQKFGHTYQYYTLPRKDYQFFKGKKVSLSFYIRDDDPMLEILSSDVCERIACTPKKNIEIYKNCYFPLREFSKNGKNLSSVKDTILKYSAISDNANQDLEDISIRIENGKMILGEEFEKSIEAPEDFSISADFRAICTFMKELETPYFKNVEKDGAKYVQLFDDNTWIFMAGSNNEN